jgi:hypothetical protein
MKQLKYVLLGIVLITSLYSCSSSAYLADDTEDDYYYGRRDNVSFDRFYNELSPFGRWVYMPSYGRVWITNERGFRPYYNAGHWENSRYGYAWRSDYSWGWAPFHYGRWGYDNMYGWFWVPGYEWSPGWVDWRSNNSYYGWAPLGPAGFRTQENHWIFMDQRYMNDPRTNRERYILGEQNRNIYQQTNPMPRAPRIDPSVQNRNLPNRQIERQGANDDVTNRSNRIFKDEQNRTTDPGQRTIMERPQINTRPTDRRIERVMEQPAQRPQQQVSPPVQRQQTDVIHNRQQRVERKEAGRDRPVEAKREQ